MRVRGGGHPAGGIALTGDSQIKTFDRNGGFVSAATIRNPSGEKLTLNDIDIDSRGDQYVSYFDSIVEDYPGGVVRFSASGQFLSAWDGGGSGDGQFGDRPINIGSSGSGNLYVADDSNYRIQRFTDTGAYLTQWGQLGTRPGQFLSLPTRSPLTFAATSTSPTGRATAGSRSSTPRGSCST